MNSDPRGNQGQSGQAMVEAALTLPLVVFLLLGTLQLFLMLQARVLAHYAAFQATRAGSVAHGECERMTHAAILALIPSFHSFLGLSSSTDEVRHGGGGGAPARLAAAFRARRDNRFQAGLDGVHTGSIVWINRAIVGGGVDSPQDREFDEPGHLRRLEVQLIYWYPMRIPFANWVMSRMFMAQFGIQDYRAANPLILAEKDANWNQGESSNPLTLAGDVRSELASRVAREQYVFPIEATFTMRMLTPTKRRHFASMDCPR
ncbi:pilus biogenesis protein [Myxococcus stipitatus DSM 14675]|uniref:Pilus biogenesis protein n=1 Tax=Myxococcus stipitatus (strain DSM 14675 / JCM 12634 / Mx s8) TaxID=1278073 RepID=L7U2A3_MYXSD|nr:TadE/TadG family type IV pilus assembly protein [Myxococcus stipitatus]AGC41727.1 pilus biogenesis protein [Myxococcus stipitatus DSM 14675]